MRRGTYLVLAAACLVLAGCGGPKPDYKYRIAVIPKGLTHEFWQSIHRGAERAAAELKEQGIAVEVLWDGPRAENDTQAQIDIISRNLANGVNGIVLAPQHSQTMVAPVERAVRQNVPVVIIDSGLDNQEVIVKYIATNNYNGGRLAAERLLKVLRAEGKPEPKLVLFRYAPGSESTEQREKGFEDYVRENAPAATWLSKDQYAGPTPDTAQEKAMPLLNGLRGQGIDGVFAPNESSATGMLKSLQSLRLNKQVRLVGFDSSPPLLQALADGDIDGVVLQDPYRMGFLGVWTVVQHLEGKDVAPGGKKEKNTGEYVLTRDDEDLTHHVLKLNTPAALELYDPEWQQKRDTKKMLE
jgi:ribose transport system substrate-binding protein